LLPRVEDVDTFILRLVWKRGQQEIAKKYCQPRQEISSVKFAVSADIELTVGDGGDGEFDGHGSSGAAGRGHGAAPKLGEI